MLMRFAGALESSVGRRIAVASAKPNMSAAPTAPIGFHLPRIMAARAM